MENNDYEMRFWKVLERDHLADLSQFHKPESFDEVPLFSRERDIEFLPSDKDKANQIVLRFALKFLRAVVAYDEDRLAYFAAITLWSHASDPLMPYLFAWSGDALKLKKELSLAPPTTSFAKKIRKLLAKVDLTGAFALSEDTATLSGETRVFIAPERPPYRGFVPLSAFHKSEKPQDSTLSEIEGQS